MNKPFDSIDDAIAAIGNGDHVVVVDDEDRENEGDLILAAAKATPEKIAFMVRHTSGILCAPVTQEQATRLHLDPMVARNEAPLGTAFTVSIDFRHGLSTGIAAEERANTVLALASNNPQSSDFVRPGHVFPLVAKRGGVLVRSGHTEAAVDLAEAAGCAPVGVLAEIVNDDGSLKRLDELLEFAKERHLKIISIADLISWRQRRERLVERTHTFDVSTPYGLATAFAYRTKFEEAEHLALMFGKVDRRTAVLVRIHRERLVEDLFGPQRNHRQSLLHAGLKRIQQSGDGVFIYLRSGFAGVPIQNLESPGSSKEGTRAAQWLEIGVGAQILRDLGIDRIRVLAGREVDYIGLEGFGLTIASTELLN
ncbi:MAG: 3,4-dihydroxy-2-butanone-4-phosphate synthase [Pseudomonadales bacterium]|nr:3,4-dihydroxy-2-butanone-4-phosphate synthase [Pseudomonadales bacterium]